MKAIAFSSAALAAMLVVLLPAAPAQTAGLNPVSYVSGSGHDAGNTCFSPTSPCLTLGNALLNTLPGGEIICVGGGLIGGDFAIVQSVTIDCAGTTGNSYGAIDIEASAVVTLRNLTINPVTFSLGPNTYGIRVSSNGVSLLVENCFISGFKATAPGVGIQVVSSAGTSQVIVRDTTITNNGFSGGGIPAGILIQPTGSGSVRAVIERTTVANNVLGIVVDGSGSSGRTVVEINDSLVAGNAANGIVVNQAGMLINRTSVEGNSGNGILAGPGAVIHLGASTVATNALGGLAYNGGQIFSYQNNQTKGNGTDNAPSGVLTLN